MSKRVGFCEQESGEYREEMYCKLNNEACIMFNNTSNACNIILLTACDARYV